MMNYKKVFSLLTILLYIIVVLHVLALYFFWYWSIWWYDILLHTLGGAWVGGTVLVLFLRKKEVIPHKFVLHSVSLVSVIIIGILWELFEFSIDTLITFELNDVVDTMSDMGSNIVGALFASLYISSCIHYEK